MVKDQEYLRSKASFCLDLAKKLGATGSSVTVGHSISETVNFRNNTLDESNRSDGLAISIETYLGKKRSSISSSNLLDDNIKTLIEKCFETTKNTPEDEFNNGQIGSPIKWETLIGDGPSILKEVSMVGNDMMLDPGIGTCGKAGHGVPVGVAHPSILIDKMTVGGTKL